MGKVFSVNGRIAIILVFLLTQGFFSLLSCNSGDTLSIVNNLRFGGYIKHGNVLPHHGSIAYSLENPINGIEILLTTDTYGRSAWDKFYRYPRLGLGYDYSTLGNADVYGSAHALFGFLDVPILRKTSGFNIFYQFTVGLSYLTKHFNIEENPLNQAISSGLNVYGDIKFTARYIFHSGGEISAGFGLTHYSNGKMGTPNLGLNSFNLALGYARTVRSAKYTSNHSELFPQVSPWQVDMLFSAGMKADDKASESRYLISTVVADYIYNPGPKYAFGGGVDFFYDQSLGPNVADDEFESYTQADLLQAGLHGGVYARYGRFLVTGHVGTYVLAKYYKYARVYSRIGCRYSFNSRFFFNISLKAHYAIADYVEWGIGYRIHEGKEK